VVRSLRMSALRREIAAGDRKGLRDVLRLLVTVLW
jgi:hypothetical protein